MKVDPEYLDGAELIAQERQRQIVEEGWSPEHDDNHKDYELSRAAKCYTSYVDYTHFSNKLGFNMVDEIPMSWPWHKSWWKPSKDPIQNLVKAGALIAAEIDRLKRERSKETKTT